jgi:aldose 1-epimerase
MICPTFAALLISFVTPPSNYSAERGTVDGIEIIRLRDVARKTEVSIVPSIGNNAYEMTVNGKQVFWSPYRSLKELQEKPVQLGNPLLAPWANRIDGDAYWANGRKYLLNPELKNFRYDSNKRPIHGLLVYARQWKVTRLQADADSAAVTSRLEFWRYPEYMAQFPFAHAIEMTYRLKNGNLEVETSIENLSADTMPLSLGYHTYYRIDDSPRDDWQVHIAAREHVVLSSALIPTGNAGPVTFADPHSLRNSQVDDVFTSLLRDASGRAEFWVRGKAQRIKVQFGPKFDVAIVFAPPGREFICFEPMVGLTNVFNLAHAGLYKNLQTIPPGGTWTESFWILPEGY